jgi:AcrR family transcriptional regulator
MMSFAHSVPEPKWRRLPEERPHQIIDAAIAVFGEHGLAGARLEDVAKRAGVSKGTIYLYFPNKEALFAEMIRSTIVAQIMRDEEDLDHAAGTPSEEVERYIDRWFEFMKSAKMQAIHRLIIGELHHFPDLISFYADEVVTRKMHLVDRLIRRGVETGEFRAVDPETTGRILGAIISSFCLWSGLRQHMPTIRHVSDEELIASVKDFFFHAIRPAK